MSIHETRCECHGQPFFGTYEIVLNDNTECVVVRYNGEETVVETRGVPAENLARSLLIQMVVRRVKPDGISVEPPPHLA